VAVQVEMVAMVDPSNAPRMAQNSQGFMDNGGTNAHFSRVTAIQKKSFWAIQPELLLSV
jgi:hypothetical protein